MVHALFWTLGTPGLSFMPAKAYQSAEARSALTVRVGAPLAAVGEFLADVNRFVRLPLVNLLSPLQAPYRVSQDWNLYRDGPDKVRRLEIWVDDGLVYRSVDDAARWLEPQLRNRRIRPVVETTVMERRSPNWRGLTRFIVASARRDFPEAKKVEMRCLAGDFPGRKLALHHLYVAVAPDWKVVER